MQSNLLTSHAISLEQDSHLGLAETSACSVLIRNVGIATDFSPCSDRATLHALAVARRFGAAVHFFHAISRSEFALVPDLMVELDSLAQRDSEDLIHRLQKLRELDGIETHCWIVDGDIPDICSNLIRDHAIDLLVLGTHGRSGLSKFLSGSMVQQICRQIACPVLTVGPWSRNAMRQVVLHRLLLATDLPKESRAALPYAFTAARTWNDGIDILNVFSPGNREWQTMFEDLAHRVEALASTGSPVSICMHTSTGKLSQSVLGFAAQNQADLIVLGLQRQRSIYSNQNDSDAYDIVCQATCPVLHVPSSSSSASR